MFYKNTFKFFQFSMNTTFETVSCGLRKISASHPLLLLSDNMLKRLENSMLKTILSIATQWQYSYIQPTI